MALNFIYGCNCRAWLTAPRIRHTLRVMDATGNSAVTPGQASPSRAESLSAHAEGSISEDAILAGAFGDPRVASNIHAKEILLGMRFQMDLYANVRPVRLLEAALVHLPKDPAVLTHLGRLDVQDGRGVEAERHFRQVLKAEPADTEALYNLASALQLFFSLRHMNGAVLPLILSSFVAGVFIATDFAQLKQYALRLVRARRG